MGRDRQWFRALCENSWLPPWESASGGHRKTISQGNSRRGDEKARFEKLSGCDPAKAVKRGLGDECGGCPVGRGQIDALSRDDCDGARILIARRQNHAVASAFCQSEN